MGGKRAYRDRPGKDRSPRQSLQFHCELGTGLRPTSMDETDFAGVIWFGGRCRGCWQEVGRSMML